MVIRRGPDKDSCNPQSYRPVSLLPAASIVLERLIVNRFVSETEVNMSGEQHDFSTGRSTVSAIRDCLDWPGGRKEKLVVGVFLDISGAFDNLKWAELMEDMVEVGASEAIRAIVRSYLSSRWAELMVERSAARVRLTRRCPQGSILWKIAMDRDLRIKRDDRIKDIYKSICII